MIFPSRQAYRDSWSRAEVEDPQVPLSVDLELAAVCNLECPFCFIADSKFDSFIREKSADGKPRARFMPTELAFALIDQCADLGVPALKLNWRGESTLHPYYSAILKYAAGRIRIVGIDMHGQVVGPAFHDLLVNTNAYCKDSALDGLMAATKVMVSHDSLDPTLYSKMRVKSDLARVKAVVHELIRRGHQNLWVRRVVSEANRHERFYEAVRQEYGDSVRVSQHFCFDRNAAEHHQLWDPEQQKFLDAAAYGRKYCAYPSQRLVVAASGNVMPCCIDLQESIIVGHVPEQSLASIWQSYRMVELRSVLRRGQLGELPSTYKCQACESWMAYDAPQRAFVGDVEVKSTEQEQSALEGLRVQA